MSRSALRKRQSQGQGAAMMAAGMEHVFANSQLLQLQLRDIGLYDEQVRQHFDETGIEALANSIEKEGILQPIVVTRKQVDGKHYILAGERRFRAAQLRQIEPIPAVTSDLSRWLINLVENAQRESLNPMELAVGASTMVNEGGKNFTQEDAARALGVSPSEVSKLLRAVKLPKYIQTPILQGEVSVTRSALHELSAMYNEAEVLDRMWKHIRHGNATIQSIRRVRQQADRQNSAKKNRPPQDTQTAQKRLQTVGRSLHQLASAPAEVRSACRVQLLEQREIIDRILSSLDTAEDGEQIGNDESGVD